jgi:hypothetical protein
LLKNILRDNDFLVITHSLYFIAHDFLDLEVTSTGEPVANSEVLLVPESISALLFLLVDFLLASLL